MAPITLGIAKKSCNDPWPEIGIGADAAPLGPLPLHPARFLFIGLRLRSSLSSNVASEWTPMSGAQKTKRALLGPLLSLKEAFSAPERISRSRAGAAANRRRQCEK